MEEVGVTRHDLALDRHDLGRPCDHLDIHVLVHRAIYHLVYLPFKYKIKRANAPPRAKF